MKVDFDEALAAAERMDDKLTIIAAISDAREEIARLETKCGVQSKVIDARNEQNARLTAELEQTHTFYKVKEAGE